MIVAAAGGSCGAAITGAIVPNSVSPVQAPGETRTYTFDYCTSVSGDSGKADVLFLIDTTGDMGGPVDGLESEIGNILSTIRRDLAGVDIEYGMADYKDWRDGGCYRDYGVCLRQTFTNDVSATESTMSYIYCVGGFDDEEAQLKALASAAENWTTTSGNLGFNGRADAQKVIVWFGCTEGHYFGEEDADGPAGYYPSLEETVQALNRRGIPTFGLNAKAEGEGIDQDYGGANQATYLTEGTGGKLYNDVDRAEEVYDSAVDAIMTGIRIHSNISLALEWGDEVLIEPVVRTRLGAWTPQDGDICGSFTFDITSPDVAGVTDFELVLLGNGAELDRVSLHLTTIPEPGAILLLGLGSLSVLRKRQAV